MELGNFPLPLVFHGISGSHQPRPDIDLPEFVAFEGGASAIPSEFASPAHPVFDFDDMSSSINSSHMGTVSPNDLRMTNDLMSHPGSAALTALTTPSTFDGSPAFTDSWDGSPLFAGNDMPETWPSLFPDAQTNTPAQAPAAQIEQSPVTQLEDLEPVETSTQSRKSSASKSPSGRHSSVSGVNARRRGKPLPPILVEDITDTVKVKRAKNTLAARLSRERKAKRMESLEQQIQELEAENEKLQAERDHWKAMALANGSAGAQ